MERFGKPGPLTLLGAFGGFFLVLFFVYWVLDTEFFRGNPDQGGRETPVRNEMTALAHTYCAQHAAQRLRLDPSFARSLAGYTAWDLGFHRYLVQAAIERLDDPTQNRRYLCRILWQGDNPAAPEQWTVQDIELIP